MSEIVLENVALTKGSQQVLKNKAMVADLADSIRDDSLAHPQNFPQGFARSASRSSDEQLAEWFLSNLDKIEREGYEGTIYSRDGQYNEWVVRKYIAGSHNWEDITGVMNMNMRDWYILKNRNLLDARHRDIPKFSSVRELGQYMITHYGNQLEEIRQAAKNAARAKFTKSIKLVDNEDYRVYVALNRAAGCALGLGTQWCTANSKYGGHFHNYADRAMLFQVFPYLKQKDESGNIVPVLSNDKPVLNKEEKYQFDAGSMSFMDITDRRANPSVISQKFPYLFSDIVKSLKANQSTIEQSLKDMNDDPALQEPDYKVKQYNVGEEIKKLEKFLASGFFTDQKRPESKKEVNATAGNNQLPSGEKTMENADKDVLAMIQSLKKYDKLVESKKPIVEKKGNKKPDADGDGVPDWADKHPGKDDHEEEKKVDESVDQEVMSWMKRFNALKW